MCYRPGGVSPDGPDKRAVILEALREARPGGIAVTELWRRYGAVNAHVHILSLQGEGHHISQDKFEDRTRGPQWGWRLDYDVERDSRPSGVAADAILNDDPPPRAATGTLDELIEKETICAP